MFLFIFVVLPNINVNLYYLKVVSFGQKAKQNYIGIFLKLCVRHIKEGLLLHHSYVSVCMPLPRKDKTQTYTNQPGCCTMVPVARNKFNHFCRSLTLVTKLNSCCCGFCRTKLRNSHYWFLYFADCGTILLQCLLWHSVNIVNLEYTSWTR